MSTLIKDLGVWKEPDMIYVKDGGVWKDVGGISRFWGEGEVWAPVSIDASGRSIRRIAFGGGIWVGVGDGGLIVTSIDRRNWIVRAAPSGTGNLNDVAYNGSYWVAVGDEGRIIYSTSGSSWLNRSNPLTGRITGITYGGDNWVAVGEKAQIAIAAPNTTGWTIVPPPANHVNANFSSVASNGSRFVALGNVQSSYITSTNPNSWTSVSGAPIPNVRNRLVHSSGRWLICSNSGDITVSSNPTSASSWVTYHTGIDSNVWDASYGNGVWVAVGVSSVRGTCMAVSTNNFANSWKGIGTWSARGDIYSVCFGDNSWVSTGAQADMVGISI